MDREMLVSEQTGRLLTRATWDSAVPAMLAYASGVPTRSRSRTAAG